MFTDIGRKIKGYAKAVCLVGVILSVILGISTIVGGAKLLEHSVTEDQGITAIVSGCLTIVGGALASWVGSFLLYGFGELIDRAVSIDKKLSGIYSSCRKPAYQATSEAKERGLTETLQSTENSEWTGADQDEGDYSLAGIDPSWRIPGSDLVQCPKCGEKRSAAFILATKACPVCGVSAMKKS